MVCKCYGFNIFRFELVLCKRMENYGLNIHVTCYFVNIYGMVIYFFSDISKYILEVFEVWWMWFYTLICVLMCIIHINLVTF